ncbi:MAG: UDP-N-acetylmuramoyl-tripeptide--D-alanyl-D-alanine ligase [Candidatus Komeilibacteria bacterium]|jgi:UDP-N-acetylmuramoyl-tripeptide--D-alanyl-D-alanine ligase|nr:UDP-N-acetylmuramoyl-tripeptide--D-alanyl-D-alanine ligase [Candidatus Komeilibacteria bacterium]MBT4447835.1 UDP-N-acetylmuramoyl-tripeptide--D-alanyl-D-alanine ligase [Candidatus Komeilibacteria bacterium]
MKKILHFILKILAKAVINKYQPKVIAITGSVGKTSAKEAIAVVLRAKFNTRTPSKNFNNEIGTPLTILGQENSPGKNILAWLWIFILAIKLVLIKDKNYPEVLVLEMGADKPGDIKYLTAIASPDISIITAIGSSHIEFFRTIDNIVKEKSTILDRLNKNGLAILNNDDVNLVKVIKDYKRKIFTFGKKEGSNVRISEINITNKDNTYGTSFKLTHSGSEVPMFLPYVLGWQHAYAAASAALVALYLDMNLVDIAKQLLEYKPARGRTNLIRGIKNTWIIDDSYNASPQSAKAALDLLSNMPSEGRKIAVLGDMLELGALTEEAHQEVGRELIRLGIDYLFVVGEKSRDIARGAKAAGMDQDNIYHFPFTKEAGVFLQERLKENDIILVKGSRGAKMEQIVYEIMAKPWRAKDLLVGQIDK